MSCLEKRECTSPVVVGGRSTRWWSGTGGRCSINKPSESAWKSVHIHRRNLKPKWAGHSVCQRTVLAFSECGVFCSGFVSEPFASNGGGTRIRERNRGFHLSFLYGVWEVVWMRLVIYSRRCGHTESLVCGLLLQDPYTVAMGTRTHPTIHTPQRTGKSRIVAMLPMVRSVQSSIRTERDGTQHSRVSHSNGREGTEPQPSTESSRRTLLTHPSRPVAVG